jgi:hypothetical protein
VKSEDSGSPVKSESDGETALKSGDSAERCSEFESDAKTSEKSESRDSDTKPVKKSESPDSASVKSEPGVRAAKSEPGSSSAKSESPFNESGQKDVALDPMRAEYYGDEEKVPPVVIDPFLGLPGLEGTLKSNVGIENSATILAAWSERAEKLLRESEAKLIDIATKLKSESTSRREQAINTKSASEAKELFHRLEGLHSKYFELKEAGRTEVKTVAGSGGLLGGKDGRRSVEPTELLSRVVEMKREVRRFF